MGNVVMIRKKKRKRNIIAQQLVVMIVKVNKPLTKVVLFCFFLRTSKRSCCLVFNKKMNDLFGQVSAQLYLNMFPVFICVYMKHFTGMKLR